MNVVLPDEFADLQKYAERWALSTENQRRVARRTATTVDLRAFYGAILPRLPEILHRVDQFELGALDGADRHLFHMAMSLAEVAPHVEYYDGNPNVPFSFDESHMIGVDGDIPD